MGMVNCKVGLGGAASAWWVVVYPFKNPARPDPAHPVPPLIGDGTPVSLRILFCSNGEPAKGPHPFLNVLGGGIYKFLERM